MTRLNRPPAVPILPLHWQAFSERHDNNPVLMRFFEKYGEVVWLRVLGSGAGSYLVSNPAYVKHFLTDAAAKNYPKNHFTGIRGIVLGDALSNTEGAHWLRHRRMLQPAFQRDKVLALTPRFVGAIERLLDKHWEPYARSGEPMHLFRETSRIAMILMGQMTLSMDTPDDVCEAAFEYMWYYIRYRSVVEKYVPMPDKLALYLTYRKYPKLLPSAHRLNDFAWEQVRARRAQTEQSDDLLGHLLQVQDEKGVPFTDLEVRDEFLEFLYGGHISPGISMAFTWHLLGQHADVREQMYETVDRALGGRAPTVNDFPALQYVSQVYDEALRIHAPAPGVQRPAIADDKLGDYDVPKGTMLSASAYVMHRHPAYWKNPYAFDPTHFDPEVAKARPRFVYIPYGGGQRVCIGAQMATLEALLVNSMIAQRYRLEPVAGKTMKTITGGAHYPDNLWMKVVPARARRLSKPSEPEAPVSAVA